MSECCNKSQTKEPSLCLVGAVVGGATAAYSAIKNHKSVGQTIASTFVGAAVGAAVGVGLGAVAGAIAGGGALATTTAMVASKATMTAAVTASAMTGKAAQVLGTAQGKNNKSTASDVKIAAVESAKTGKDVLEYAIPVTRVIKGAYEGAQALNNAKEYYDAAKTSNDSGVKTEITSKLRVHWLLQLSI